MANEAIDLIITRKAREELIATREEITRTDAEFIKLANNINAFAGKQTFPTLPKGYEERIKQSSNWTAQLNANNKEAERLAKALAIQKAKLTQLETKNSKALAKARLETQILNKALKDEAVLSSKLVGEYRKLTVRRNQAATAIKNEIALNGENSKKLQQLRAEFKKLDARYVSANRATRDFRDNVGNYKSALGGATGALRSFVGVFGVYSGIQIAREVYDQIKAIDGMNKALKQVTETQDLFNQSQFFLKNTANESGANVINLTNSYTKFLASAKTTNLTLKDTQNIFRQVAKAAGILGLSTDDTNGAFRALEQILSKGKVQAEEIRGQLGERLPGAFQILAKSMGLTTRELSKQLELGNVISEDVLPNFARELEKTYSLDKVERVETLAAAQNRLSNAWTGFIEAVEGGEGTISKVLGGMLELITESVKGFEYLFKSVKQVNDEFNNKTKVDSYNKEMEAMQGAAADLGETLKQVASRNFFDYTKAVEESREKLELLRKEQEKSPTARVKKEIEAEVLVLALKEGRLNAVNDVLRTNTEKTKENVSEIKKETKEIKEATKELEKYAKAKRKGFGVYKDDSVGAFDSVDAPDDSVFRFGIDALEVPDTDEINDALNKIIDKYSDISEAAKLSADDQKEIFDELFSTFSDYYELDLNAFTSLMAGKEVSVQDYANMAKSIVNSIYQNQLLKYESEIEANQERLDAILNDEYASDEKKAQAQLEADRKEAEINKKQAKAERNNVLIQIGIDTAAAVVKALPNLALSAVVAGFGAAQAAFVASQPLPEYYKGTDNAKEGVAYTDEKGAELHTDKFGNIKDFGSSKGARVKMLSKGDKIYTAQKTESIYRQALLNNDISQKEIDLAIIRDVSPVDIKPLKGIIEKEIKNGFKGVNINNINKVIQQRKPSRYHV